jgi:glycosyltransferase involved in cell wall biosynthesis
VNVGELSTFLRATDVYVAPYFGAQQIVSGTISYALAAGLPIVSTPSRFASELLADGRGRLVPFRDSAALAAAIIDLLEHASARDRIGQLAYDHARTMTWDAVARAYTQLFTALLSPQPRHVPALASEASRFSRLATS